ncbi:fungal specific transcription factor domain-containing protein, partial [Colletotrichum salicis]
MERLLAHYTGKSTLDAETLKTLAESVEKMKSSGRPRTGPEGAVTGAGGGTGPEADMTMEPDVGAEAEVQSQSSDSFKVDEITVQPLENNITRK